MTIGIYKLKFKNTNKVYIGQSTNIEKRYNNHLYNFKNSLSSGRLLGAYRTFGVPELEILCECTREELNSTETEAIELYNSIAEGFNTFGSSSGLHLGAVGENSGQSKFNEEDYIAVFNLLVEGILTHKEITSTTGVTLYIVQSISKLECHKWLELLFPEKYNILKNFKGKRMVGNSYSSSKNLGITYPKIKSPLGEIFEVENVSKLAKEFVLDVGHLHKVLTGIRKSHKGWKLA